MHDLHLALGVLVDGERVDHTHGVALAELLELLDDLTVEVRMLETDDEQLNRPDCHDYLSFLAVVAFSVPDGSER